MEHEKATLLDQIKASRAGMRVVNSCIKTFPELAEVCYDILEKEQNNIKLYFSQLVELERSNEV